ncbi:MAG: alpha/beta hydrolase [Clostridiaceae bacterium]
MKKGIKIVLAVAAIAVLAIGIIAFFTMKSNIKNSSSNTSEGELNIPVEMNLQLDKILNPESVKGKSLKEIREYLNSQFSKWSSEPIPFTNIKNTNIDATYGKIPVRIYTPEGGGSYPVIIYAHGGCWVSGSVDGYEGVCRKLSQKSKAIVISVGYRLAPDNPFPAAVTDVYNVLLWAGKNAKSINGNENKLIVAGDSAGGNIAAAVTQMARDKNGPRPICQVLIYPAANIKDLNTPSWTYIQNKYIITRQNLEEYISMYVPKVEDRKNPYASPLLANNFANLSDALIITAEIDPLRDEGEAYGEKLKEAGVQVQVTRYNGVPHGFISMDKITDKAEEALNEIASYIQKKSS